MSSLIFLTEENQVLVATDTLATSTDGKPAYFTTKAFIIPHLRMIICGTGVSGFAGAWFIQINDRIVLRGIDNLDFHAPNNLTQLWREFKKNHPITEDCTTTIYHFGFSEEENKIHSYVYRSINNFKSESLNYGLGIKPECKINTPYIIPRDIEIWMREQRKIQKQKPINEKVYIGGEIQVFHLTIEGFSIYKLDRFEDYYDMEKSIYHNYNFQKKC